MRWHEVVFVCSILISFVESSRRQPGSFKVIHGVAGHWTKYNLYMEFRLNTPGRNAKMTSGTVGTYLQMVVSSTLIRPHVQQLAVHKLKVFEWSQDSYKWCENCQAKYRGLLRSPFEFSWQDGKICLSPCHQQNQFLLNLQRGIVNAFATIPRMMYPKRRWKRVEEGDIFGICMTDIMEFPGDMMWTIRKKRYLSQCADRPTQIISNFEANVIPGRQDVTSGDHMTSNHRFVRVRGGYRLNNTEIKQDVTVGSSQATMRVSLDYAWTETAPSKLNHCPNVCLPVVFEFEDTVTRHESVKCNRARLILEEVAAGKWSGSERYLSFLAAIRRCSWTDLKSLFDQYAWEEDTVVSSAFLDALPSVGTGAALRLIRHIVDNETITLSWGRKQRLVTGLANMPLGYYNSCSVLSHMMAIVKQHSRDVPMLTALGSLIGKVVTNSPSICRDNIARAVQWLKIQLLHLHLVVTNEYEDADESRFTEDLHTLKAVITALGRSRCPECLSLLKSYAGKGVPLSVARDAWKAMTSIAILAPQQVQDIALWAYFDSSLDAEVRIAAFDAFMSTINCDSPSPTNHLKTIVNSIHLEKNSQVQSSVYTHLKELAGTSDPSLKCRQQAVADTVQETNMLERCQHCDLGYLSSKTAINYGSTTDVLRWLGSEHSGTESLGASVWSAVTYSENKTLPSSWTWNLAMNVFGYRLDTLEFRVSVNFLDELIRHLFGPAGYFRLGARHFQASGLPMKTFYENSQSTQELGEVFFKLFGQDITWKLFDRDDMTAALYTNPSLDALRQAVTETLTSSFSFEKWANVFVTVENYWNYLVHGDLYKNKFSFLKTFSLGEMRAQLSTIIGVPLVVTANGVFDVKVDVGVNITKPWFEADVAVDSNLRTSFSSHVESAVSLADGCVRPHIRWSANASGNWTHDINAKVIASGKQPNIVITYNTGLKNETSVAHVSSRLVSVARGVETVLMSAPSRHTSLCSPIGGRWLGVDFLTPVTYTPSSGGVLGSLLSASGPFDVAVRVRHWNAWKPITYVLTIWNESLVNWDAGRLHVNGQAVGTNPLLAANASVVWTTSSWNGIWKERTIDVSVWTTEEDWDIFRFHLVTGRRWNAWLWLNGHNYNTSAYLEMNRTDWHGNVTYTTGVRTSDCLLDPDNFRIVGHGHVDGRMRSGADIAVWKSDGKRRHQSHWTITHHTFLWNINSKWGSSSDVDVGLVLPFPATSFTCHAFGQHILTFDGLKYVLHDSPDCTYVLARHRHPNDTFAVTLSGTDVKILSNGTVYTLTRQLLKVNGHYTSLPYTVESEVTVKIVVLHKLEYVYIWLGIGIHLLYGNGGIRLTISGYYANQMAGLCGNADGSIATEREMIMPDLRVAYGERSFVESWNTNAGKCSIPPEVQTVSNSKEAVEICHQFFAEMAATNAFIEEHVQFHNACVYDAISGRGLNPSVYAYVLAANAVDMEVDACIYGLWSDWSVCKSSKQHRTRSVNFSGPDDICSHVRQEKSCDDGLSDGDCRVDKKHVIVVGGGRACRSREKLPSCDGRHCVPVWKITSKLREFHCIRSGESEEKFANASPVLLPHQELKDCVWH